MANTAGKKRAPQKSLALEVLIPVDVLPEKKSGSRSSHLTKIAAELKETPGQWYKIAYGRTQSAYQKRKRLVDMSGKVPYEDGKFQAEVRAAEEDGMSEIYARFMLAEESADGS